jgi:phospholipase C
VKVYVRGEVGFRHSATFLFDNKKFKVIELNKNLSKYKTSGYIENLSKAKVIKIKISLDDKSKFYDFETEKSQISTFKDRKDVPCRAEKLKINIPKGKHKLYIEPVISEIIAVRVLIPEKMLK